MEGLEDSDQLVTYVGFGVGALVILVVIKWIIGHYANADERALEKRLRAAIDRGDLRKAGDIQAQRGLFREAARIYERAGDHARTARALVKVGDDKGAAAAFDLAKDMPNAAIHYQKAGNDLKAAECFVRVDNKHSAAECFARAGDALRAARFYEQIGEHEKAADQLGKLDKLEPRDLVLTTLENGALATNNADKRKALYLRAAEEGVRLGEHERAARAFEHACELARAAHIYEHALNKFDVAGAIRDELGEKDAVERLSVAAGGMVAILKQREARARARGDGALAKTLGVAVAQLSPATEILGGAGTDTHEGKRAGALDARFEILGELGRGGMGIVYQARDRKLQRVVALKFLPDDIELNSVLISIFRREARAAAALSHPAIVTVYDVGTQDGRDYIAMEFVEGETLDSIIIGAKGGMPVREALDVMNHVAGAIEFAHSKSVIHRDLKPSNVMRTRMGVKVMDFGLAKVVGAKGTTNHQTVIGGTPAYMPPEQLTGDSDHRADIFALGATFFEMLTGRPPGTLTQTASMTTDYPSPREISPNIPARLSDLVMRCLDHDRSQRPQDVGTIVRELREVRLALDVADHELRKLAAKEVHVAAPAPAPSANRMARPKAYIPIPREDE
jgi:tetratricopeptide (TPR) repeat protein